MKVENHTPYRTDDLRKFFAAGLRAMGAKADKTIEVWLDKGRYTRSYATIGRLYEVPAISPNVGKRTRLVEARWIRMLVYRDAGGAIRYDYFARVFEHEVLHSRAVEHRDMTPHQMKCDLPLPAWAEGLAVRLAEVPAKPSKEARATALVDLREAHARSKLAEYQGKAKRVSTLLAKWKRKVRYYERRAAAKVVPT